eukprot:1827083-Ditylum_brightwellii.AAC.1
MVDTIQKTLLSKDKAQPLLIESMEECIQKAIATQLEKSFPAIVEATVNHLMSNKFIDKAISTTIGTIFSKITCDESTKATNENPAEGKSTTKEVTQTPEQDPAIEENDKRVSKEILLQRRISAIMREHAEKENEDKEQKEVNFAKEPPDKDGIQQE